MYCNKDVANGEMVLNLDGIMNFKFENNNTKSEYFLVAKEV